jgi:non-specific serine/threonine protein kinase
VRELQRIEEGLGLESGANAPADKPEVNVHDDFHTRKEPSAGDAFQNRPLSDEEEFDYRRAMMERQSRRERSSGSWKAVVPALALVLVMLGIGVGGFMYYSSTTGKRDLTASRMREAPAAAGPTAPPPVAEAKKEPVAPDPLPAKAVATERVAMAQDAAPAAAPAGSGLTVPPSMVQPVKEPTTEPAAPPVVQQTPVVPPPQTKSPVVRVAKAPAPAQQPAGTAQLVLAISPGGEVYIDGQHLGTAPQTTKFDLEPGMRRVEIRSGSHKPFLTFMTVEAGDVRRIRHDFDARPSRPPS